MNWVHQIIWKYLSEDWFCQLFPKHRLPNSWSLSWTPAIEAHNMILVEADGKCQFIGNTTLKNMVRPFILFPIFSYLVILILLYCYLKKKIQHLEMHQHFGWGLWEHGAIADNQDMGPAWSSTWEAGLESDSEPICGYSSYHITVTELARNRQRKPQIVFNKQKDSTMSCETIITQEKGTLGFPFWIQMRIPSTEF